MGFRSNGLRRSEDGRRHPLHCGTFFLATLRFSQRERLHVWKHPLRGLPQQGPRFSKIADPLCLECWNSWKPIQRRLGGSFNPGVFSGEPNSVQQTDNHLNSSLDIKLNTVEHLRAWLPWFFLFLSPRFGFKEAINSWNVRTQGSVAEWWFWGWLAVT